MKAVGTSAGGLERYVLAQPLGKGGQGTVVAAFDRELTRPVAIKFLRDDRSTDTEARARLLREARAMASVAHPNVVAIHDVGTYESADGASGGGVYIVMERIDGPDLQTWLAQRPRPWWEIVDVFLQAAHGVRAAHAAGLVHRDLKPSNIVIGGDGRARVLDFGVARASPTSGSSRGSGHELATPSAAETAAPNMDAADAAAPTLTLTAHPEPSSSSPPVDTLTAAGQVLGTPRYMAPEHHAGAVVDARSDVFSFCASLFEALYGRAAFEGSTTPELAKNKRRGSIAARPAVTEVPVWLDDVLRRGLSADPRDRMPSMNALIGELEAGRKRSRSWPRWVLGGSLLAVGLGAGAVWWTRADPVPETATETTTEPALDPELIALLPFEDTTQDAGLSFAREGFPDIIGRELAGARLRVIPYYRLASHVERPDDVGAWRRAAHGLRAGTLVRGRLSPRGDRIALEIVLEDPRGEVLARVQREEPVERLPGAVREAALELASGRLREPLARAPGARVSLDFDRAFQTGLSRLEAGDHAAAEEDFRAAVTFAPSSGRARFYLALASWWSDRPPEVTQSEIALALEQSDLDPAQRRFLAGLAQLVRRDYEAAIDTFGREFEADPGDGYSGYGLFEAQYHGAEVPQAMQTYRVLGEAWPRFSLGLLHVLEYSLLQRDEATLAWAIERARRTRDPMVGLWEARERLGAGDVAAARERLRELESEDPGSRAVVDVERVGLYLRAGEPGMAATLAAQVEFTSPMQARMLVLAIAHLAGARQRASNSREALALGLLSQPRGTARSDQALQLLALELPAAGSDAVERMVEELAEYAGDQAGANRSVELARRLLAAHGAAEPTPTGPARFPEARALDRALELERAGRAAEAAAAWRETLRHTVHPALSLAIGHRAAHWQASGGAPHDVVELCARVVDPPVMHAAWASTVLPCLDWTAQALVQLGDTEGARAARSRAERLQAAAAQACAAIEDPAPARTVSD